MSSPAVGIDLGTSNCAVAYIHNGSPRVIPSISGARVTPSWVHYTLESATVGEQALQMASRDPLNTYYEWKRLMGRKYDDVETELRRFTYGVQRDSNGFVLIECPSRNAQLALPTLSASLLKHLLN